MPFRDDRPVAGPLALSNGFDLNPEEEVVDGNLLGAAFRSENPIVSAVTSFDYNPDAPYDPSYRAWDDIQGTVYEQYSDRFVEARNADEAGRMKAQIDREIEDRKTMDAAGAWGFVAGMGAAVLSPTSLLPGGAIVRGAGGGVSVARTAASAGAWAGAAAAIDEIALQGSQATRTAEESAYAIGGSVILGGLLGGSVGLLSREAHMRSSTTAAELPIAQQELGDQLRSVGAAENAQDFTLRRENLFGWINRTPVLRGIVRSDPILRGQLSDNREARRATAELVETPLQYGVNEQGQSVGTSAETVIKARRNTELAGALGYLDRSFTEYWHDGPVGLIGRATAPISARWQNLLGRTEKLNRDEFMNEVGRAAILGDQHPIPQVQKAAEEIRKNIFDRAKAEATEVGIFDEDLQLKNGESYFMRSYNIEKIIQHMGDGSADDIKLLLRDAYMENRAAAQNRLANDRTVEDIQADLNRQREAISGATRGLKKAQEKARGKRDRADAAVKRERAVSRAVTGLRERFGQRSRDLYQKTAKGYRPPSDAAWREFDVNVDTPDGGTTSVNAGQRYDQLEEQKRIGREMLDCVMEHSASVCSARFGMSKAEKESFDYHVAMMDDPELGAQSYLQSLDRQTAELRTSLADQGILASLDGETPPLTFYQDLQASIRMTRSALNNRPPDVLNAIRQLGGIKKGTDAGEVQNIFDQSARSIIRRDGLDPDAMREALVELGYLPENGTVTDMWDFMRRANEGEDIFSRQEFQAEVEAYEAAQAFAQELEQNGLNIREVTADDIIGLQQPLARNQTTTAAKAQEAGRSADQSGRVDQSAGDRMIKALERLEEAEARLFDLNEQIAPRVREEVAGARAEMVDLLPKLKKAKEARSADEFYAEKTDLEIEADIDDTLNSIVGLKPGEHSFRASLSSPTRARVLDIATAKLEPWLETDMGVVMSQYFSSIVPDIEITRKFGDMNLSVTKQRIIDEKDRMIRSATSAKERTRITREAEDRLRELDAMRDRIRGTYGAPDNPRSVWVRGARTLRTLSYTGYLGGMTVSALPDVANMVGRNGIEAAFGSLEAVTNPSRMGLAIKDAKELGAAAEWYLNSRAASMADIADRYGEYSRGERVVGALGRGFGIATGMVPWNVAWKSVGGALAASKMSKAAVAVKAGNATKDQLLKLSENGIDTVMAQRIADQIERFADRNGNLWLPQASKWTDPDAFAAMRNAMNREMDLMVITPGQDIPLSFSTETGKFFSQFKSFVVSSHHRVLLSGIQRADAAVLAQVVTAVTLGMAVSRLKSYVGGYDQKEGAALWEDAIDRSGLTGWLMEVHGLANGFTGGRLSISGEETSRFQSRSEFEGLLGPSVDLAAGLYEGVSAMGRGEMSSRDARKMLRPIPGNNLPYVMGLTKQVAEGFSEIDDAWKN